MNNMNTNRERIAVGTVKRMTVLTCGLAILFILFFDRSKHNPALTLINPFAEDPYDAVGSFGIQLSFAVALLSVFRAFRPYGTNEIPPNQLILILRGEAVALLSIVVTLTTDVVALVRYPSMWMNASAGWILGGLVGGLLLLAMLISWLVYRITINLLLPFAKYSWRRVILFPASLFVLAIYPADLRGSVAGGILTAGVGMIILFISTWALATAIFPQTEMQIEDIFDDFASIYRGIKSRLGFLARLEHLAKLVWLRSFFNWLNPRRHRWNLMILIALTLGASLMLVEALSEGLSTDMHIVWLILAIFIGLESTGVILGYLLFAQFLGIFRREY